MSKIGQLTKQGIARLHSNPAPIFQQRSYLSRVELKREYFDKKEQTFISNGSSKISLFKYDSGVEAVKYKDSTKEIIILPFQGHQIWDCKYKRTYKASIGSHTDRAIATEDYHSIAMQTPIFDEPIPVSNTDKWGYLRTYGAYFIHCGVLAMGVPTDSDDHILHGEVANGQFTKAYIDIHQSKDTVSYAFIGEYLGKKAFDYNYKFVSSHHIQSNDSLIDTSAEIRNYYHSALPAMYLAHVNFRPECDGQLHYTATCNEHLRDVEIRTDIPAHVRPSQAYIDLLEEMCRNPAKHECLDRKMIDLLDTEVVLTLNNYKTVKLRGNEEWAVSLQKLNNADSDRGSYVCMHKPSQLPKVVRWMVCNPNLQALGLSLPATGGPEGKTKAVQRKEMISVPSAVDVNNPGIQRFDLKHGYVEKRETEDLIQTIQKSKQQMQAN